MRDTIGELHEHLDEPTFIRSEPQPDGDGFGAINAARGSLGHWVKVRDGRIANYQVITPTTWNGSPRDDVGPARALGGELRRPGDQGPRTTPSSCSMSCARTTPASSAPCTS